MPAILSAIAKIATHPITTKLLIPALSSVIQSGFKKVANWLERRSAVKAAKAADTAEELRNAAGKMEESLRRRRP